MFQSTRPHGARPAVVIVAAVVLFSFNPRARTGRDWRFTRGTYFVLVFQSTRPHGARHNTCTPSANLRRFQSTRPHGARHLSIYNCSFASGVSIHAPARGATGDRHKCQQCLSVSIHAPARGATNKFLNTVGCYWFQSTRPHGARQTIPTSARKVTSFNPRARTGRDCCSMRNSSSNLQFQSTRPHGARHRLHHTSGGGDDVSIHAPARGATRLTPYLRGLANGFNPRARTGRDTPHHF